VKDCVCVCVEREGGRQRERGGRHTERVSERLCVCVEKEGGRQREGGDTERETDKQSERNIYRETEGIKVECFTVTL
jgi:hypothetical protein